MDAETQQIPETEKKPIEIFIPILVDLTGTARICSAKIMNMNFPLAYASVAEALKQRKTFDQIAKQTGGQVKLYSFRIFAEVDLPKMVAAETNFIIGN